ncbi:hypothetical protein B0H10DRAFT_2039964 [Mycena sp. CBHHK59/15]|nr:hypothetical protein B0H10DRAFT_2039964 [Mycena sp. CBHHK59/15]
MSCDDEEEVLHGSPSDFQKKRRIQRSCDICRTRKSDSVNGIDGRCTNCIAFNASCTYVGPARKRGPKNRTNFFGSSSSFVLAEKASVWEKEIYDERPPPYVYPAGDLVASLLDLYFTNVQPIIPLSVAEGLHLRDAQFGATLLAVLAVASRLSDDPRVFVVGETFFYQVLVGRKFVFDDPSIYEVQLFCLSSLFTLGTSTPQASWAYLGLGIRFIQQRGEHRRKRRDNRSTLEKELWKRAFWSLFSMDTLVCAFLGQYKRLFKQPLGNPSLLTYFTFHIRLSEILGATLRRLYASTKTKSFMGWIGAEWEQRAVAELDSSMNDFLDSLSTPSVVDVWFNRMQRQALPYMHNAVFLSGVVLVLNLFGAKRAGLPIDTDKELAHISTAMKFLKFAESRWQTAGRVWELLQELQSWDGPRPSRTAPNCELHPANMRPPAVPPVGSMSAETSMFTESKTAPATSGDFFTVTNELSQRQTRSSGQEPENFWNGMLSSNPTLHGSIAGTLPPAALQYSPVGTGGYVPMTFAPNDWSSGVTEVPNMTIDEDLMSVWMAAPADFGNLAAWDAYIENSKETGFNWLNDFSVPQQ